MYVLLLLSVLYINVAAESCKTPSGEVGECVPLRSCPSLMWSFSNHKQHWEPLVYRFLCSRSEEGLMVCCKATSDQLVFENDTDDIELDDVTNLKELINPDDCGIANDSVITNGVIRLQDFPWLFKVMLVVNNNKFDRYEAVGCTGVLINRWYVIYSAQCYYTIARTVSPRFVLVDSYSKREEGCETKTYSPNCRYEDSYESVLHQPHIFYDNVTKLNDIAIIRLDHRAYASEYVRPICLPIFSESVKVGETLQSAGWNKTYNQNDISVKKIQSSTVISNADCQKQMRENGYDVLITPYELCTYTEENTFKEDDIGFPLMSLRNGRWYLEGFESQGQNIKIHTRVQNYLQWIMEQMGEERCLTPYNEIGEGRAIYECPELFDAFANISPNNVDAASKFVWLRPAEDVNRIGHTLKVCCGITSNFTIFPETANKNLGFEVFDSNTCGLQNPNNNLTTTEGASVNEFPWLAVIVNASLPSQREVICDGTLISEQYLLSSAFCVDKLNATDDILVRLGVHNISDISNCISSGQSDFNHCIQEYKIEEKIIHPFYNYFTFINGIALLRLNKKVTVNDYVRPICLPTSLNDLKNYGETLYATGFGHQSATLVGPRLKKKIETTLISNQLCAEKFTLRGYILPVTPHHMCTEDFKNSTDVICIADEGGPLMLPKGPKWFIVGITGYYACRKNEPQIHLVVYKYLKWIKLHIKD